MDIEKFSECCLAKVCKSPDGHFILTVCCVLRGPDGNKIVHKKSVPLDGLIKFAQEKLAAYHASLHHDAQVSGDWNALLDQATDAARRMGEARLVRALFEELSPMLASGDMSDEESETNHKLHAAVTGAMEGDEHSLQILAGLINAAYRGNERALELALLAKKMHLAMLGKEAVKVYEAESGTSVSGMSTPELMEIGSWWSKLKKVGKVAATVAMPGGAAIWAAKYALGKRKKKSRKPQVRDHRASEGAEPSAESDAGPGEGQDMSQDSGPAFQEQGDYPQSYDPGDGQDAEVSGWLYNKGYRSTAQVATSKFPGLGVAVREMYHRGVDTPRALAVVETPSDTSQAQVSGTYIVGFSWKKLMRKAQSIAKQVQSVANIPIVKQLAPIVASAIPGGGLAYQAALKASALIEQAKKNNPQAVQAVATIRQMAESGNEKALEVAKVMKSMSDRLDQKAAMSPPAPVPYMPPTTYATPRAVYAPPTPIQFSFSQPTVRDHRGGFYRAGLRSGWLHKHMRHAGLVTSAGWVYNKPYRSVLEAPGVGLAARELYNRGTGHDPTNITDVIKEIFPALK